MNANLHRIVFNRSRGLFMAVAECAPSCAGGLSRKRRASTARPATAALRQLTLASLLALAWPAHAQIVADPTAPAGQQPGVHTATNGVPLVNITRPTSGGVSRNTYSQFDVQQQGAILNNARSNAQTQLGGWVEGNAKLSAGSARVILNEVNSANPSQLLGYIEVAGSRAEVVVANPSGITCNGCGFINADRATLTTGQAVMLDGRLDGFRVEGGRILIEGAGMDALGGDYATLIARAVEINAGIWARDLTVTAGPGMRTPDGTPGEDVAAGDAAPAFAIDVSALGGMYAGKIRLIGTEAGLGVRNAGEIGAGAGEIVVTADGRLTNTGSMAAVGDIRIDALETSNRGLISSAQTLDITTASLDNANTHADDLGLEGRDVLITASTIDNRHGAIRADRDIAISSSGSLDNRNGLISALEEVAVHDPDGSLSIANTDGLLIAGARLDVAAASLGGDGALLSHGDLRLQLGGDFDNQGDVAANGTVTLDVGNALSNRGRIESGSTLQLAATSVDNRSAGSITGDTVGLTADTLTNRGLIDGNTVHITTTRGDNLGGGRIYGGDLAIASDELHQDEEADVAPVIAARNRLDIGVGTLTNRNDALIFSAGNLAIGGQLDENGRATGSATLVSNHGGTIEALGALDITAADLLNSNAGLVTSEEALESRLIQEVQPEGWSQRLDVSFFPSIFNHRVEKQPYVVDGVVVRRFEDYTFYEYTETKSITRVESSRPGDIVAGGNLTLTGNVDNHDSRILAGGVLSHAGGELTNRSSEGARTTSYDGWRQFRDWDGNDEELEFGSKRTFSPAPIIEAFNLDIARLQDSQPVSGSGTTLAPLAIGSAGGAAYGRNTLFRPPTDPTASYLIETDPRFADFGQWISSDYMLGQLGLDPAGTHKRLGDGFVEQQLLREQIAGLTGHRFLDGYSSDEAQYMALMNAGITYAQQWDLVPGVALTAAQMAALTTDMVWLVERDVTLPDGQTTRALVPQLYARPTSGDLRPDGALLAGDILNVQTGGQVTNLGTLAGRKLVVLDADRITHSGGQIHGNVVHLETSNDLRVIGGNVTAGQSMTLLAGTDLEVASTTRDTDNFAAGDFTRTHTDRLATLHVQNPGGTLHLAAAGDISLIAAQLLNNAPAASGEGGTDAGTTHILAGGNLVLGTVLDATRNHTGAGKDINNSGSRTDVGTRIDTTGDIVLSANMGTGRIDMTAAHISSAEGGIAAQAADITIDAGSDHRYSDISFEKSKSGFLSSSKKYQRDSFESTTAVASTLSAETVTLVAGQDLSVRGSDVVSTSATTLVAGRDLTLEAAEETHHETHILQEKTSGMFSGGGVGVTFGSRASSNEADTTTTLARGSTVGSIEGDVTLLAGQHYRQVGSDVLAPQGNIDIAAERVDIVEARESSLHTQESKTKQSGLTIAITAPVITAVQTAQQMHSASKDTDDSRMQALAGATTALTAYNAYQGMQNPNTSGGGVGISITVGGSKSKDTSSVTTDTAAASTVAAGGDVTIVASGAGEQSDITVQGSQISAGRDLTLIAEDDINLLAAANTASVERSSQSSSSGVGVAITYGSDGFAFGITASAARGNAEGDDLIWSNTQLSAGDTLTLRSGDDTTLRGAVASGERVVADVGGDLSIESLQDISTYQSCDKSAGGSVTIGYGFAGSVQVGQAKVDSDFGSVAEQSALRAGDGGFDVRVGGDTTLTGGAITSTDAAVDGGLNHFETGGELALVDIQNRAEYEASSYSVGFGGGMAGSGPDTLGGSNLMAVDAKPTGSAGVASDSDKASSTTVAAISGIAGNVDARTGDAETGLKPIFDADKVEREMRAQVAITQAFGQHASKAIGDYAEQRMREADVLRSAAAQEGDPTRKAELEAQAADIEGLWGDSGTLRLIAHTVVGGLTGGAEGALGAAVGTLTAPAVADALREAGVDGPLATIITGLASTTAGALAGGGAGGAAALNEVANNFLSHEESSRRLRLKEEQIACADEACRSQKQAEIDRLDELDAWRDQQISQACQSPASHACQAWTTAIQYASLTYHGQFGSHVDTAERANVLNKAFEYQQATNNPFLHGVGKGLLALTPPGIIVGGLGATHMTVQSVLEHGAADTLINIAQGIAELPADLKARLSSDDPTIRGEALVDFIALGTGATMIATVGGKVALNQAVRSADDLAAAKAAAEAIARAKQDQNFYRDGGIADPTKPLSATSDAWKPAAELTPIEAANLIDSRLPNGVRLVDTEGANTLNSKVLAENPSFKPPYVPGTQTMTIQTVEPTHFVRVYNNGQNGSPQAAGWMFRAEDVVGLSPEQIASKYALPQIPNMRTDVTVPAGQQLRVSVANDIQIKQGIGGNGGGGGVQFEVLNSAGMPEAEFKSWFSNPRAIK